MREMKTIGEEIFRRSTKIGEKRCFIKLLEEDVFADFHTKRENWFCHVDILNYLGNHRFSLIKVVSKV